VHQLGSLALCRSPLLQLVLPLPLQYYLANGYMFPAHTFYWIGLNNTGSSWLWVAPDVPTSALATYSNWGTQGSNTCGGGTSTAGKISTSFGPTWAWGSSGCATKQVYMCRMAPPGEFHYTSVTYKSEYALNTQPASFSNANLQCQVGPLWRRLATAGAPELQMLQQWRLAGPCPPPLEPQLGATASPLAGYGRPAGVVWQPGRA
jgi:hypothetical protein